MRIMRSSPLTHCIRPRLTQFWPRFASLPIASPDHFLIPIPPFLDLPLPPLLHVHPSPTLSTPMFLACVMPYLATICSAALVWNHQSLFLPCHTLPTPALLFFITLPVTISSFSMTCLSLILRSSLHHHSLLGEECHREAQKCIIQQERKDKQIGCTDTRVLWRCSYEGVEEISCLKK